MKVKLDENLGALGRDLLERDGHDVSTVADQQLSGAGDEKLYEVCSREGRALVTLDHDFGHVTRFPPELGGGIAVLECGGRMTPASIRARIADLTAAMRDQSIKGRLWIVEPGRVRIRQQDER
jgi:predicted nuclease of predicted toxin-antitoxin system